MTPSTIATRTSHSLIALMTRQADRLVELHLESKARGYGLEVMTFDRDVIFSVRHRAPSQLARYYRVPSGWDGWDFCRSSNGSMDEFTWLAELGADIVETYESKDDIQGRIAKDSALRLSVAAGVCLPETQQAIYELGLPSGWFRNSTMWTHQDLTGGFFVSSEEGSAYGDDFNYVEPIMALVASTAGNFEAVVTNLDRLIGEVA